MSKELVLYNDFKNDILFKFLLCDDQNSDCIFMLKPFIENILNIQCDQITVLNPAHTADKDTIIDIKIKTTNGNIIDIDMQNSTFSFSMALLYLLYRKK